MSKKEELLKKQLEKIKQKNIQQQQEYLKKHQALVDYYENIIALMPGHVYWLNKNNVYLGCNNEQAQNAKLTSRAEIVGKRNIDMPWKDQARELDRVNKRVMKTGIPESKIEYAKMAHGEVFLSKKVPLKNSNHEIIGLLGISLDITELKKAETALKIAKERAEYAHQVKSDFISNMEHDLRTPFSGISGIANVLYSLYSEKYPELKPLLEIMINSCTQWEMVHNKIFDVLALEQIKPIEISTISLSKELLAIQDEMAAALYLKGLEYIIKPISPELEYLKTDALKLRLILTSLISNAINFTEKGSIKISVHKVRKCCVIKIEDTGIGIPNDRFDYIFEKFTKLSRSNTHGNNFKGLGLGLFAAKQYVNLLGATISVTSTVDKGSIFSLKVPITTN